MNQQLTPESNQKKFLQALLAGDRHAAKTVALNVLSHSNEISDIYVDVLQESLYQIGELWENNRISVAQEHLATAITQYVMVNLFDRVSLAQTFQGRAIITGVEGELHQVGAHMVADVLEIRGWDVRFLGANVPRQSIIQMVEDFQPQMVGFSATARTKISVVEDLIKAVRSSFASQSVPRIVIGGGAFRSTPNICQEIHADEYCSDLRSLMTTL